jgi:hypothetical protein
MSHKCANTLPFGSRDDEVAKNTWVEICKYVCMYIYIHIYMYVYMYVYTYTNVYVYINT